TGSHEEVNATKASTSRVNKFTKSKKKKPKRLCKFCNTWNVHLTRHLKRKHKTEEEVVLALKLPRKDQAIKKEGIFKANIENRKTNKDALLIRERCQGSGETVMCTGCRGFYDAKSIFKHKRTCERNVSALSNTAKLYELSDSAEAAGVDSDFKDNILDRFRKDEVGKICRTDLVTILFGKKQWAKSIKKERNITMSEMRLYASLILAFRLETGDEEASGQEILNYRRFEALEKAIKSISTKETGEDKVGLKVRIGFVLKRAAKIMRGYFVMKADAQKEADMTRFLDVIELQWHYIFLPAQIECEQRRTGLRKPSAMPDEEDISVFRDFIKHEMVKLTEQYEMWDKHTFVRARNLVVARLTMFNARRGGEPARLTLKEWKEAITDAWIDPNLVEKVDDPMEKHLLENLKLAYQSGKALRFEIEWK
ncbi:histone-lysine N-methyltransferase SETD8-A, partial [Elysia marginata]